MPLSADYTIKATSNNNKRNRQIQHQQQRQPWRQLLSAQSDARRPNSRSICRRITTAEITKIKDNNKRNKNNNNSSNYSTTYNVTFRTSLLHATYTHTDTRSELQQFSPKWGRGGGRCCAARFVTFAVCFNCPAGLSACRLGKDVSEQLPEAATHTHIHTHNFSPELGKPSQQSLSPRNALHRQRMHAITNTQTHIQQTHTQTQTDRQTHTEREVCSADTSLHCTAQWVRKESVGLKLKYKYYRKTIATLCHTKIYVTGKSRYLRSNKIHFIFISISCRSITLSVCINTFNSKAFRTRTMKIGNNMSYDSTQNIFIGRTVKALNGMS